MANSNQCFGCAGTGTTNCAVCDGQGKTGGIIGWFRKVCRHCSGRGAVQCPTCNGKGQLPASTLPLSSEVATRKSSNLAPPVTVTVKTDPATLQQAFSKAFMLSDITGMKQLLQQGVDVNAPNESGVPPLLMAAHNGDLNVARLLLTHGARVDGADRCGETPLMRAAIEGSEELLELLLQHGADAHAKALGNTAKVLAQDKGHTRIVQRLDAAEVSQSKGPEPHQVPGMTPPRLQSSPIVQLVAPRVVSVPGARERVMHRDPTGGEIAMEYVPPGEFWRGADNLGSNAKPRHRCQITRGYYVGVYPVTVGEYRRFVKAMEHTMDTRWESPGFEQSDDHPVVCVSWDDAQAYATWAGLRLPTAAEWEYAARGTDSLSFPWGNEAPDDERLWSSCSGSRQSGTCAVGQHPKGVSPFGVHDMAGNVWEWVADWYGPHTRVSDVPILDPSGATNGKTREMRGGSWSSRLAEQVHAANRMDDASSFREDYVGFRCARQGP